MRRTLVLAGSLLLLWAIVAQLNDALSALRVHVFAGALFVAFTALTQPRRAGLAAVMLGGLICDANTPVAFGTHMLLFAAAHTVLFQLRERVTRDDNTSAIVVVLLTNLALFLIFSFTQIHDAPLPAVIWPRLVADLVCSQIFLVLVTPWFFALQAGALALARIPRDDVA
jgi:rod shape-determining protein MreD